MLKKTLTFKDLDDNDVTEDFYFNLSKAEIAEMEVKHKGGFGNYLQKLVQTQDGAAIMATFKEIIQMTVGRRSENGRHFIKSPEITAEFIQSDAYSELFMSLVTDADAASEFIRAVVPSDIAKSIPATSTPTVQTATVELPQPAPALPKEPAWIAENREPTEKEIREMSPDELRAAFARRLTPTPPAA